MRLILFEIFGIKIYSYGFMIAIGIIFATMLFISQAKKRGYDEDKLLNLTIFTVIAGAIGGKLLYILVELKSIIQEPKRLLDIGNGFVIYGSIILGALTIFLYCKKNKWNVLETLDLAVPSVALAQGFGRIGCFLAGCCYGAETNLPIGVTFPVGSLAEAGVKVLPTQLFSSAFDFVLALILFIFLKKKKNKGNVFALYVILYSIGRFIIEFFRNDDRGSVGLLSTSQFIAIFTLIFGIALIIIPKIKRRKVESEKN